MEYSQQIFIKNYVFVVEIHVHIQTHHTHNDIEYKYAMSACDILASIRWDLEEAGVSSLPDGTRSPIPSPCS